MLKNEWHIPTECDKINADPTIIYFLLSHLSVETSKTVEPMK